MAVCIHACVYWLASSNFASATEGDLCFFNLRFISAWTPSSALQKDHQTHFPVPRPVIISAAGLGLNQFLQYILFIYTHTILYVPRALASRRLQHGEPSSPGPLFDWQLPNKDSLKRQSCAPKPLSSPMMHQRAQGCVWCVGLYPVPPAQTQSEGYKCDITNMNFRCFPSGWMWW